MAYRWSGKHCGNVYVRIYPGLFAKFYTKTFESNLPLCEYVNNHDPESKRYKSSNIGIHRQCTNIDNHFDLLSTQFWWNTASKRRKILHILLTFWIRLKTIWAAFISLKSWTRRGPGGPGRTTYGQSNNNVTIQMKRRLRM